MLEIPRAGTMLALLQTYLSAKTPLLVQVALPESEIKYARLMGLHAGHQLAILQMEDNGKEHMISLEHLFPCLRPLGDLADDPATLRLLARFLTDQPEAEFATLQDNRADKMPNVTAIHEETGDNGYLDVVTIDILSGNMVWFRTEKFRGQKQRGIRDLFNVLGLLYARHYVNPKVSASLWLDYNTVITGNPDLI